MARAKQIVIQDNCPECDRAWPEWPERPSLSGGCAECRREYHRRYEYSNQDKRQKWEADRYERHQDSRRDLSRHRYHRSGRRFSNHGITRHEFKRMYVEQDGKCAICSIDVAESEACIDHDHKTGEIRGLLCTRCNTGLGFFGDDFSVLMNAARYLNKE